MSQAAAGYEVALYRHELEVVLDKIMKAHTERRGCEWLPGALDAILCDLAEAVEKQEICKAAA